jgi:hypothetical protein
MNPPQPTTLPTISVELPTPSPSKWEREYEAFRQMLPRLLQTHRGQYVAVHEGQVIESGSDPVDVTFQALSRVGNVDVHVGHVTDEPAPLYRSGVRRVVSAGGAP